MNLSGRSLIAGEPAPASSRTFRAVNPATGAPLDPVFFEATEADAARAINAAASAFDDLGRRPAGERAAFLEAIADRIEAIGDTLIERAVAETGLPAARMTSERGRTCGQLRMFAELAREGSWIDARIDTGQPDRQPAPRPDIRRMLKPIGPVVVFGASNFPLAFSTAGGDTASAFAAGCPVVVKAHPAHPGTGELVGRAIASAAADCGLAAGVFSLVHGGPTTGVVMVRHPATAAVGFTGSHLAGRALFDAASSRSHPIPVFAEMSSVNPVFLLPGALRTRPAEIVEGLVTSFTLGVGQFCTKPGLVFVVRGSDADAFIEQLAAAVRQATTGIMLTAGIRDAFLHSRDTLEAIDGVTSIARAEGSEDAMTAGQPSIATTDARSFLANPALATEAFGPFTLIVKTDNSDEMLACADAIEGQLTASMHGTDDDLAAAGPLIATAERFAGRLIINGYPTGVEVGHAMHHGGPYPATTDARFTSVGTAAILRFARPVCYQGFSNSLLPAELRDSNPAGIVRTVNGEVTRDPVGTAIS